MSSALDEQLATGIRDALSRLGLKLIIVARIKKSVLELLTALSEPACHAAVATAFVAECKMLTAGTQDAFLSLMRRVIDNTKGTSSTTTTSSSSAAAAAAAAAASSAACASSSPTVPPPPILPRHLDGTVFRVTRDTIQCRVDYSSTEQRKHFPSELSARLNQAAQPWGYALRSDDKVRLAVGPARGQTKKIYVHSVTVTKISSPVPRPRDILVAFENDNPTRIIEILADGGEAVLEALLTHDSREWINTTHLAQFIRACEAALSCPTANLQMTRRQTLAALIGDSEFFTVALVRLAPKLSCARLPVLELMKLMRLIVLSAPHLSPHIVSMCRALSVNPLVRLDPSAILDIFDPLADEYARKDTRARTPASIHRQLQQQDYTKLSLIPHVSELRWPLPLNMLPDAQIHYESAHTMLDTLFKLYRADAFLQLQALVVEHINSKKSTPASPSKRVGTASTSRNYVHTNVQFVGFHQTERVYMHAQRNWSVLLRLDRKPSSSSLMYGNLLAVSPNGSFAQHNTLFVAIERDDDKGSSKKLLIRVRLLQTPTSPDATTALLMLAHSPSLTCIESPVFFVAFASVMTALQRLSDTSLPFPDDLAAPANLPSTASAPPAYVTEQTNNTCDWSIIFPGASKGPCTPKHLALLRTSMTASHLDVSQLEALEHILSHRLALVQGPPGTGKSRLASHLVALLLSNPTQDRPIVVITYKNKALDDFCLSCMELAGLSPGELVRLGSRSQDPKIAECSASKLLWKTLTHEQRSSVKRLEEQLSPDNLPLEEEVERSIAKLEDALSLECAVEALLEVWTDRAELVSELMALVEPPSSLSASKKSNRGAVDLDKKETLEMLIAEFQSMEPGQMLDVVRGDEQSQVRGSLKERRFLMLNWLTKAVATWLDVAHCSDAATGFLDDQTDDTVASAPDSDILHDINDLEMSQNEERSSTVHERVAATSESLGNDLTKEKGKRAKEMDIGDGVAKGQPDDYRRPVSESVELLTHAVLSALRLDAQPNTTSTADGDDATLLASMSPLTSLSHPRSLASSAPAERRLYLGGVLLATGRVSQLCSHIKRQLATADSLHAQLIEQYQEALKSLLSRARIVAMTTTGAAIHDRLVRSIEGRVLVVEEAAEILEPQLLACLHERIEHVIQIGDHLQLQPTVNTHRLKVDKKFRWSLFERLVKAKRPFATLRFQGRQLPTLVPLLQQVHTGYKGLESNMNSVAHLKAINCLYPQEAPFTFLAHSNRSQAMYNEHEAFLVLQLLHLLTTGSNPPVILNKVTVLAGYARQVELLKKLLSNHGMSEATVMTVDAAQGAENDVVIVSLVRSAGAGTPIGFMSTNNRIVVLASRARRALYLVGHGETFKSARKSVWPNLIKFMSTKSAVVSQLDYVCPVHGRTKNTFSLKANVPQQQQWKPPLLCCEQVKLNCKHTALCSEATASLFVCRDCIKPVMTGNRVPPSYWTSIKANKRPDHGKEFFDVTDSMRHCVEDLMNATAEPATHGTGADSHKEIFIKFKVLKVERCENWPLWERYAQYRRQRLEELVGERAVLRDEYETQLQKGILKTHEVLTDAWRRGDDKMHSFCESRANEHFLFHGTDAAASNNIGSGGFIDKIGKGMFGEGCYFAERSSKSDHYTGTSPPYTMFVARVTLGLYHEQLHSDNTLKMPPCSRPYCHDFKLCASQRHVRPHSVVFVAGQRPQSHPARFREFIVYDKAAAYPEYRVTYKRVT